MCMERVWPTVKANTIDNSTKNIGERWTSAGPELIFCFLGVRPALVLYPLVSYIIPENITVLTLDGLNCPLRARGM